MFIVRFIVSVVLAAVATVGLSAPSQAEAPPQVVPDRHAPSAVHLDRTRTVVLPSGTTITPILAPGARASGSDSTADFSGGTRWWGYQVRFTKAETRSIAAGAGSCSVIVGKLPSLPSKIASAACGLLAVWAGYVLSGGDCLSVNIYWTGTVQPSRWNC